MNGYKYRVAQVGCGGRGRIHLEGWIENPDRFELVGVCELDEAKMKKVVSELGIPAALYTDADRMLAETRPDIFCFSTQPHVRLSLVKLAVKHGVKGLVFEKPMATSLAEAKEITRLCRENSIKTAVSHQQKYLTSFQKLKELLDSEVIGKPTLIHVTCQPWLAQLGTHYVDYVLWANNGVKAKWVVGHVHGKEALSDSHASPNYTMGQIGFENGVRAFVEFGKLSISHMDKDHFWVDNRMTVYGTHGYVWCDTDGRWGAFTHDSEGEAQGGEGETWDVQQSTRLQPLFARDMAHWLDDEKKVHPCNIDITYHGYEIMEALCLSALNHVRIDLPLDTSACEDIFERMRRELPECPDLS